MSILSVRNLVKHFPVRGGVLNRVVAKVHALNDVSFDVERGEVLGVVGESGCGKSTLGKVIVRLHKATSGHVIYDGQDITQMGQAALEPIRRKMQMVFQDPNSSLNPRMTIGGALREVIKFHGTAEKCSADEFAIQLLEKVGMRPEVRTKYPHEFSGGQKQRVGIARALAVRPEFIVADEPVSALDVSIQAQVLNLLMDLKKEFSLTMMFVSHDLKVIDHFSDRMLVMYLGHIVEEMPCQDVAGDALHPYTKSLLGANPPSDPSERKELTVLEGEVPSPFDPPSGCPFVTRCPIATQQCHQAMPPLEEVRPGHRVACWEVESATTRPDSAAT